MAGYLLFPCRLPQYPRKDDCQRARSDQNATAGDGSCQAYWFEARGPVRAPEGNQGGESPPWRPGSLPKHPGARQNDGRAPERPNPLLLRGPPVGVRVERFGGCRRIKVYMLNGTCTLVYLVSSLLKFLKLPTTDLLFLISATDYLENAKASHKSPRNKGENRDPHA